MGIMMYCCDCKVEFLGGYGSCPCCGSSDVSEDE